MTSRPLSARARTAAPKKPSPRLSNTTVGRKAPAASSTSPTPPTTTSAAPRRRTQSAFAACPQWPHTVAPRPAAAETSIEPTPPLAPRTSTLSVGFSSPFSVAHRQAVTPAMPITDACCSVTPSGTGTSAASGTTAAPAHNPSRFVPSPWPRTITGWSSTHPDPSVPGVRGKGASGATRPSAAYRSTGLTPAKAMCMTTSPGPGGRSSTSPTANRREWASSRAARVLTPLRLLLRTGSLARCRMRRRGGPRVPDPAVGGARPVSGDAAPGGGPAR